MIEIQINNSYSQILGLNTSDFKALRKILSYTINKGAFYRGGRAILVPLLDKKGFFPTGLLNKVRRFCAEAKITDLRVKPLPGTHAIKLKSNVTPYLWQLEAREIAVRLGRGGVVAATGSGKSLLIALIASRLKVKTLVVVPSREIKRQLLEAFSGVLEGYRHITVENIDSSRLPHLTGYDCLIIDEVHHAAAKTYRNLNKTAWANIYHRFFLTATYFRNDEDEQLLFEGVAGEPIYKLTMRDAIRENYIVPVEAYYLEVPKIANDLYTYREVYNELVIGNELRNAMIADLMLSLMGTPTLCLVKEIAHGNILSAMTGVPFVSGEDEESKDYIRQFNSGGIMSLIGTTGVLGEGIDTKPAEFVIIAGLGKAKSAFLQQIGRGVRRYRNKESCKIILVLDRSHKFTLTHFKAQVKVLKEELGIEVIKLEV